MRGVGKSMFSSPASNGKESVVPNVVGQNADGSDKVDGYKVHLGNDYYLEGTWRTKEEAEAVLEKFLEMMERRLGPPPPTNG